MSERSQIGQSLPRLDSVEKVTGRGIFAADIQLPGMQAAKFLASPHPHAEILSIRYPARPKVYRACGP